jgi:hypothetical protein
MQCSRQKSGRIWIAPFAQMLLHETDHALHSDESPAPLALDMLDSPPHGNQARALAVTLQLDDEGVARFVLSHVHWNFRSLASPYAVPVIDI